MISGDATNAVHTQYGPMSRHDPCRMQNSRIKTPALRYAASVGSNIIPNAATRQKSAIAAGLSGLGAKPHSGICATLGAAPVCKNAIYAV
jgi:hypothetical protein